MGYRIKEAREAAGLTQQQLADELSTTQQVVYRYEKGEHDIKGQTLLSISQILGVSLEFLYGVPEPIPAASDEKEAELITAYRSLNDEGKVKVTEYASLLVSSGDYQRGRAGEAAFAAGSVGAA